MFQGSEPVTICYQFVSLLLGELETVAFWKPLYISFDCLIEYFGLYLIELGKVGIHHNLLSSDGEDAALDGVRCINVERCGADGLYFLWHILL